MASPQSPCILRAYLIKAKSSVPAVNCYLWGSFFSYFFFFSKVVGYFQNHTDLGNRTQHTNEFTPLADFMQTTSKLNMRSGFSLRRTHGRGFCSLSLSFMQAFFHTIRHYRIECFSMEKLRFFFLRIQWPEEVLDCQWHSVWQMDMQLWSTPEGGWIEMRDCGL